jgi:putative PIN family toxin of toxin-antitoxin system
MTAATTTAAPPRVVLDTVVFVQCLISGRGAAAACLERLRHGHFILFISDAILAELNDVPRRPELTQKYSQLTPARVDAFIGDVQSRAVMIHKPPNVFSLPRDPDDEMLIDLAVAADATFIVTWNERHLTYLMKRDTTEGIEFCRRFPQLQIVAPPLFLRQLANSTR